MGLMSDISNVLIYRKRKLTDIDVNGNGPKTKKGALAAIVKHQQAGTVQIDNLKRLEEQKATHLEEWHQKKVELEIKKLDQEAALKREEMQLHEKDLAGQERKLEAERQEKDKDREFMRTLLMVVTSKNTN